MIKASGISSGFVWLATELNLSGGAYVAVAFLVVCVIAMAAGSSIGTMFTVFPILYPAGVAVGAQPVLLAGALLSGALFGDNLAPISDTTVISASSQRYRRRKGLAEVGGVVRARAPYALSAALVAAVLFYLAGMGPATCSEAARTRLYLVPSKLARAIGNWAL